MSDLHQYQGSGIYDRSKAYVAAPRYYQKPNGAVFGVFAVNEGIETVLPVQPQLQYHPDGKTVTDWRLLLYSRTKGDTLGDVDFYDAMRILAEYAVDSNDEKVLIRALSLTELDALLRKCRIRPE